MAKFPKIMYLNRVVHELRPCRQQQYSNNPRVQRKIHQPVFFYNWSALLVEEQVNRHKYVNLLEIGLSVIEELPNNKKHPQIVELRPPMYGHFF